MTKSKLLFISLFFCLICTVHADLSKPRLAKIAQLQKSITTMFSFFLKQHPELEKYKTRIINNLDNYGHRLTDNEISQCNTTIKEVLKYRNYWHLSYIYSGSILEMLEKKLPNAIEG